MHCRRLGDIGSDHASVPLALLREGSCESVLVTDIRQGPLSVASRRALEEGRGEEFQTKRTDGLDGIALDKDDVLLISGLGGDTIAGILECQAEKVLIPKRVIVQPQTKEEIVRSAFLKTGLVIADEQFVEDRGRLYLVMISDRQASRPVRMSRLELFFGPVILSRLTKSEKEPLLHKYVTKRIRRLKKRAAYDRATAELLRAFEQSFPISYNRLDQC
ncbi:MAG: SAM-dependent methyltransferase [Clostridiaceae bacterium]|nr:SAM-dependent methyltransferase [Clostridiaceae bacterium]